MRTIRRFALIYVVLFCISLVTVLPAYAAEPYAFGLRPSSVGCPEGISLPSLNDAYKSRIAGALTTAQDVYGQQQLEAPGGPTYNGVKDFLSPIMYSIAPAAQGGFQTDTGVYYIPFGQPKQSTLPGDVALTVADGSQIISNKFGGLSTRIFVGTGGQEQFGSCLANLDTPELYNNYLPVLELHYKDANSIEYQQESLATLLPGTDYIASFVEITADRGKSKESSTHVRVQVCENCNLHPEGNRLVDDQGRTHLYFSPGAVFNQNELDYTLDVKKKDQNTIHIVRLVTLPARRQPTKTAGCQVNTTEVCTCHPTAQTMASF
ncbi:hypothetical protein [Paenibacillus roseipurpureus]|uniref:Uncharacterized protein n=1 Tax=Paenibacillus roseopurpureus TaxID=2918901 RepID=A0AA96RKX0_9BACL|nr:hypothetical protein [Paenibacillus sp. MBLB1832]WNR46833.1 hypothetical protein MJB10_12315 [Paenibacillus sp. MBLB1832]